MENNKPEKDNMERIRCEELEYDPLSVKRGESGERRGLWSKNGGECFLSRGVHGGFVKAYSRHQPFRAEQERAA